MSLPRIKFKTRPNSTDIMIGLLSTYEPSTPVNINIVDLSYLSDANVTNKSIGIIESFPSSTGILSSKAYTNDILITNKVGYNFATDEWHPLWYYHPLGQPLYSTNVYLRSIEGNAINRQIGSMIDNKESIVIFEDENGSYLKTETVKIYETASPTNELNGNEYYVDLSTGIVYFADSVVADVNYTVEYYVFVSEIELDLDPEEFQIEVIAATSDHLNDHLYTTNIYFRNNDPISIVYKTKSLVGMRIITETIRPSKYFVELDTDTISQYIARPNHYYIRDDNTIRVPYEGAIAKFVRIYFTPNVVANTFIHINDPMKTSAHSWFMDFSKGRFVDNGYSYTVQGEKTRRRVETALTTNFNTVSVAHDIMYTVFNNEFQNIKVYKNRRELEIDEIDGRNIKLKESIAEREMVYVEYEYKVLGTVYDGLDLNPLKQNRPLVWNENNNYTTGDKVLHKGIHYECILDHNNEEPPDVVYWTQIDYDRIDNYFIYTIKEGTNQFNHHVVYKEDLTSLSINDIMDYYDTNIVHDSDEVPIALIIVENTYRPTIASILDGRYRGGGIKYDKITEVIDGYIEGEYQNGVTISLDDTIWSKNDIGRWDGELFDVSNFNIFEITPELFDYIKTLIETYDRDAILEEDPNIKDTIIEEKAYSLIERIVEKRRPIGSRYILQHRP